MIEQLFSLLKKMPEYTGALESLRQGENIAITGIGQINRSHILAGLCRELGRPMVLLCQDDIAARRLQEELKSFLEADVPILPGREADSWRRLQEEALPKLLHGTFSPEYQAELLAALRSALHG